ncbi:MAG: RidA family protein [Neisseriaceae bacterium]|nr:MAG: RidA family protein [Neisseriaceae bacterium]
MGKEIIQTEKAPSAIGPYSQAVKVGKTVYLSGQIPIDPVSGNIVANDFKEQAIQVFKNLKAIVEASGGTLDDLVKVNVYLDDLVFFSEFNEVMQQFLQEPYPARVTLEVSRLPKDALVEVEAIAVIE